MESDPNAGDPSLGNEVRVTEARLRGFGVWHACQDEPTGGSVVTKSNCGPHNIPRDLVSIRAGECNRDMRSTAEAVRLLAYVPDCTDAAIGVLEKAARSNRDGGLSSDLAAAYAIRAQRHDDPADLLRALDAAEAAVQRAPQLPEALFNRALMEETLGFAADAMRSWDELSRVTTGDWRREAQGHRDKLRNARTRSEGMQWSVYEKLIPEAVKAGDRKGIDALVAPYTAAAEHYIQDKILPAWAAASAKHDTLEAQEQLQIAHAVADAVARRSRDRYLLDVVEHIQTATDPATVDALVRGHLTFGEARATERTLTNEKTNAQLFSEAEQSLGAAGSPMRFGSLIPHAAALMIAADFNQAYALLDVAEAAAKRRNYPSLLARIHSGRGYAAMRRARLIDSIAEYTEAQRLYTNAGDRENVANVLVRNVGLYRLVGNHSLAWREAFEVQSRTTEFSEPQSRNLSYGECALAAWEIGFPKIALRYQNESVQLLREDLARNPNDESVVAQLRKNLSIALRARAAIRANLRQEKDATEDLNEALARIEPSTENADAAILNGFRARLAEARAQTLERTDRKAAIAALSEGIAEASRTQFSSLLASLLVQRARLHQYDHDAGAEERDLVAALSALAIEERAMLDGPKNAPDRAELLWSPYFARYQDTYRRLIQRLVERGDDRGAFAYAERARGLEPLNLILKQNDVPPSFRAQIRNGDPFHLDAVEQLLPLNTFLLHYTVLEDRTYVWIIWRGDFARIALPYGNHAIEQWTTSLQALGATGAAEAFVSALDAPSRALLQEPLAHVAKLSRPGSDPKVVIVPDRAMHGLPFAALKYDGHYAIESNAISVSASATLYAYSLMKDAQRAAMKPESILIVADPAFNPALAAPQQLYRLGAARVEASHIERLYEPLLHADSLKDRQATVDEFLRLAKQTSIIHIAAHGIANPEIPSRSYLLFAPGQHDSGALEATRLLSDLHPDRARLAVVASCSSAGGTAIGPEGLAPLVRPLIASGIPGVVGTLWRVRENASTAELLVRFHRNYRDGRDADDALRLAQLEMLNDRDLSRSSAIVWAPFQMVGFASSPFKSTRR